MLRYGPQVDYPRQSEYLKAADKAGWKEAQGKVEEAGKGMKPTKRQWSNVPRMLFNCLAVLISGLGLGWLIGLSASPVLQVLVAGILTLITGVTSALVGLEDTSVLHVSEATNDAASSASHRRNNRRKLVPIPLALSILGIATGASLGVYGRTHEWLGADPQTLVTKWSGNTGFTKQEISRRIFNQLYPTTVASDSKSDKLVKETGDEGEKKDASVETSSRNTHSGSLFSGVVTSECTEFESVSGPDLRRQMLASQNKQVRNFAQQCRDDAALKAAVENLICHDTPH